MRAEFCQCQQNDLEILIVRLLANARIFEVMQSTMAFIGLTFVSSCFLASVKAVGNGKWLSLSPSWQW